MNLNEEWAQINNIVNAGIIPSSERIKEYLLASCFKQNLQYYRDNVLSCIRGILRMEEVNCISSDAALKELLALLESDKSPAEFTAALSSIVLRPTEPALEPTH